MRFGFSYVGFIYLVMLLVPNLIWAKNKPEDYALYAKNENRILLILERAGEILVSAIVLVCSDFNLRAWTPWCLWLVASFFLMILYELYWYRDEIEATYTFLAQVDSFSPLFSLEPLAIPVLRVYSNDIKWLRKNCITIVFV